MFSNPKTHSCSNGSWYDYYADYADAFVADVLDFYGLPYGSVVLDPWNGSGTTTQIAEDRGYAAYGYDLNPAMIIVARARRLDSDCGTSLDSLCADIISKSTIYRKDIHSKSDELLKWLSTESVQTIRNIEMATYRDCPPPVFR